MELEEGGFSYLISNSNSSKLTTQVSYFQGIEVTPHFVVIPGVRGAIYLLFKFPSQMW